MREEVDVIATLAFGKLAVTEEDVGVSEGIKRQRVRATEYVIAAPAEGRLAMTKSDTGDGL